MISEAAFRKLKAPEQIELLEEAIAAFPEVGPPNAKNPSYRWAQIKDARRLHIDLHGPRGTIRSGVAVLPGILPAHEVNEWLRSLPPVIPPGG
jgi:hypothetical protein